MSSVDSLDCVGLTAEGTEQRTFQTIAWPELFVQAAQLRSPMELTVPRSVEAGNHASAIHWPSLLMWETLDVVPYRDALEMSSQAIRTLLRPCHTSKTDRIRLVFFSAPASEDIGKTILVLVELIYIRTLACLSPKDPHV